MSHLTEAQRYTIEVLLKKGMSKNEIAKTIGKHRSVIYREINRNKDQRSGSYHSSLAQRKYRKRIKEKPKHKHFTETIKTRALEYIKEDYSPEQVVGICSKKGYEMVSHETLYQFVWSEKKKGNPLYLHLRTKGKRYRKRGNKKDSRGIIRNRVSIEKRPESVERRNRFGDLEGDLIIGKNHDQAIVTLNDRSTGILKMKKVKSKDSGEVAATITDLLKEWLPFDLRTLTLDNGKEFARHYDIAKNTGIDVYFAHPYHSWERGSNENLNGLIRQYFPKGSDFSLIANDEVKRVENKLNNRPRKRYGFDSPIERMENLLFNQSVALVT